jgi:hypothetical protein
VSSPEFSWFSIQFSTKTTEENLSWERSTDDEVWGVNRSAVVERGLNMDFPTNFPHVSNCF